MINKGEHTASVHQIGILTALSSRSKNALILTFLFSHLKKSSIFQRFIEQCDGQGGQVKVVG